MNLISLGGSGASRSIFHILKRSKEFKLIGFLDNRISKGDTIDGYKCLGNFSDSFSYKKLGYKFITGIGSANTFQKKRTKISSYNLENNDFIKLISNKSTIETNEELIKAGSLIFDYVFLGYEVKVGFLSLINTKTYVGHETSIEDYCVIGPNCTICGNVKIQSSVYIGAGSTIRDHLHICSNVLIGCGAVVTKNILKPGIYAGVPAKLIKEF
tara:strand:+ start:8022 stop:8660 length:639 start_codon:yes stop_codon:yes gene_type:complete